MSATVSMRINSQVLNRIDQSAKLLGKSRTQFMLDEALKRADELLPDLDQTQFELSAVDFAEAMRLLEQQPDAQKQQRLLRQDNLPWEK